MPEGVADAAVGGPASQSVAYAPAPMMRKHSVPRRRRWKSGAGPGGRREAAGRAQGPPSRRILSFSGITGTSDPAALRGELQARLMDPALVAALAGLPSGTD